MTRFARAKGSKASNVKTPENSTPWEVMKEQLVKSKVEHEEATKRLEAEKQRVENYNNFLKDQKTQKREATWCDFPETSQVKKPKLTSSKLNFETRKQKKEKNKSKANLAQDDTVVSIINDPKDNKKPKIIKNTPEEPQKHTLDGSNTSQTEKFTIKKKKNKKKLKQIYEKDLANESTHLPEENACNNQPNKNNLDSSNDSQVEKPKGKKKRNKTLKESSKLEGDVGNKNIVNQIPKSQQNRKKKLKMLDGKPTRRKEINDRSFELIINGKYVELVRFDGFPIMKRDAERLQELKTNMIKKGIPKSEVQRTLKLERRRAEKALARLKRDVCYNCRKGGHNLSDCPDLKSNIPGKGAAEGVCFKCGSTEHRQFECKVQRDKEFRFATCFICKESGHIARQCPDNPKGLYPNGGGCKLCGDVTHLRKDCPTAMDKKEETSIKLPTLVTDNIEDISQPIVKTQEGKQRKPKKIKF